MKVLIAGDFCPQQRVRQLIEADRFDAVFSEVKETIATSDYSIVNFECSVTTGTEKPIEKCGPHLQCSEQGLKAVRWVGFDCVTLANNHFYDFGEDGVKNTLFACEKYGLDVVGGGRNLQDASKVLYKEINGEVLAVINCCEHEFSIATEKTGGSNPLNPIQQYYAIQEARQHADYVLIIIHGGHEHYQLPSPRMQETYRFLVDAGADAVVNHHQHCYSGYELYKGKPILYGLGNFCFDNPQERNSNWNEGYMVLLFFSKTIIDYKIIPYIQCNMFNGVELLQSGLDKMFWELLNELNTIIMDKELMTSKYQNYLNTHLESVRLTFSPYTNRWARTLCSHHLLPAFLQNKKRKLLLAYLQCESHYASVINYLRKD